MRQMGEKIILVLCIVVFGIAAMNLVEIGKEYYDGQKEYEELKEYTEEKANGQQDDPTESEAEEQTIDFAELRKINEDIVAWIQIPGIGVDYPVVQGEDNEYYLHHTFRREANKAGSIFLDYRNRADFTEQCVIIYGHNMKDGSMFMGLHAYEDPQYLKEYNEVIIYTPEHQYTYQIFAAVIYNDSHILNSYDFENEEQRQLYLDSVYASRSMQSSIDDSVVVDTQSKLLTLSTCIGGQPNQRFLVEAVLTDEK